MSASHEQPLTQTQKAQNLQTRNQQFQEKLTTSYRQVVSDPTAALAGFNQCWDEAKELEEEGEDFLQGMGDWGSQQKPKAKDNWRKTRLEILHMKGQTLMVLARYEEAKSAIAKARSYLTDPMNPEASKLDELEVEISLLQA